jgi:hypothetical protein
LGRVAIAITLVEKMPVFLLSYLEALAVHCKKELALDEHFFLIIFWVVDALTSPEFPQGIKRPTVASLGFL